MARKIVKKPMVKIAKPKKSVARKPLAKKTQAPTTPKSKALTHTLPKVGEKAPDFALQDMHGHLITLSKMKGTRVILYFYPKDDTPGCTIEAQDFTTHADAFAHKKTMVFGVSKDTNESHCAFAQKYALRVTLLSDPQGKTIEEYGCWREKSMYGKKYMGIARATFVINEKGIITHVFDNVNPQGHAQDVLSKL